LPGIELGKHLTESETVYNPGMKQPRPLLTIDGNPKVMKGDKKGQYWTAILHLAPHDQAGTGVNLCPASTAGCRAMCLTKAGRGGMIGASGTNNIQMARERKSRQFVSDKEAFVKSLIVEVGKFVVKAKVKGLQAAVRLNGTSDIVWERVLVDGKSIMQHFPDVIWYDYTKLANRKDLPSNYSLTFSLAENNEAKACVALNNGMNVAVVFSTRKGKSLPATYPIGGKDWTVIDGDETDLRFTDPKGVIVGLRAKGPARKDSSGFVRQVG
jgi:hypothetical protein